MVPNESEDFAGGLPGFSNGGPRWHLPILPVRNRDYKRFTKSGRIRCARLSRQLSVPLRLLTESTPAEVEAANDDQTTVQDRVRTYIAAHKPKRRSAALEWEKAVYWPPRPSLW